MELEPPGSRARASSYSAAEVVVFLVFLSSVRETVSLIAGELETDELEIGVTVPFV